ncbi:Adenylylsulfate kinase [Pseudomonas orientalis]|uniref:adenylyl-sulfate kinase n=1 Tax=Pseudomonas orientalis TaxID=76758 RepID=UPI000F7063D9|nr:adenylyl-sulfate kinase [Pseudomonas orientalis]AZE84155.1 Adenylylsulfate kinase [Pseudomonas orientalis]
MNILPPLRPRTYWLTGLSGAGKTTIAKRFKAELEKFAISIILLDGDKIRQGLCRDLGFTEADRSENTRRIAEVARLLNSQGMHVICASISPLQKDRACAKNVMDGFDFFEVFVSTPIMTCAARDTKGLYAKARLGELKGLTGIDAPYEEPECPDLNFNTEILSLDEILASLTDHFTSKL